jgi:hypothetical protein
VNRVGLAENKKDRLCVDHDTVKLQSEAARLQYTAMEKGKKKLNE